MTPLSAITSLYKKYLSSPDLTGNIIECAGSDPRGQEVIIEPAEFKSEASKRAGTLFEGLFRVVHGVESGLEWSQGVGVELVGGG
jgi:hypothetical protein